MQPLPVKRCDSKHNKVASNSMVYKALLVFSDWTKAYAEHTQA